MLSFLFRFFRFWKLFSNTCWGKTTWNRTWPYAPTLDIEMLQAQKISSQSDEIFQLSSVWFFFFVFVFISVRFRWDRFLWHTLKSGGLHCACAYASDNGRRIRAFIYLFHDKSAQLFKWNFGRETTKSVGNELKKCFLTFIFFLN